MSDLLVILGAGASHDALREGADQPPLASGLFDRHYDDIQRKYPGVDGIRDTILARMKQGQSLESILGRLVENPERNIQRHLLELPFYLQELLERFSATRPGTYDTLITLIQEAQLSVIFVTLNYDCLLDKAIARRYSSNIVSIDDYIDPSFSRNWNYVKLHGSVDWEYRTPIPVKKGSEEPSHIDQLNASGVSLGHATSKPQMLTEPGHTRLPRALLPDVLTHPALAVPADTTKNVVCPDTHVEVLREALRSDPAVLVIGNQGLDADLMDILRNTKRPHGSWRDRDLGELVRMAFSSGKPFLVVDPSNGAEVASRFAEALGRSDFTIPRDGVGFRDFVESEEAARFFEDVRTVSRSTTP